MMFLNKGNSSGIALRPGHAWQAALALGLVAALPACAAETSATGATLHAVPTADRGPSDVVDQNHPLNDFFDNTLIVHEQGKTMRVWYNRDGTFTAEYEKDGFRISGVWENWGNDFCQTQTSDARPGEEKWRRCGKLGPYKVGDKWERPSPDGSIVNVELAPGR